MSDPISASVKFTASFSLDNVTKLIQSVRTAVLENWLKHADQYTEPAPHLEALELSAAAIQVVEEIETGKNEYEGGIRTSHTEHFSFCPVSCWAPCLSFWKYADGTMGVMLIVLSSKPRYERQADRERSRMEFEWENEREKRGMPYNLAATGPEEGELDDEAYNAWWDKYYSLCNDDTPCVWPQNRQCFLNIMEHLKSALPFKSVDLDPCLMQEPDSSD